MLILFNKGTASVDCRCGAFCSIMNYLGVCLSFPDGVAGEAYAEFFEYLVIDFAEHHG